MFVLFKSDAKLAKLHGHVKNFKTFIISLYEIHSREHTPATNVH